MIQALHGSEGFSREAVRRLEAEAEHGHFTTSRYRGRYVSWGNGPALIFIHGLADCIDSFAMPMALLEREFRCISYNQPNGRNDGARLRAYQPDHLVEDLLALMDHLGLSQAYLLGHSFGSTVALRALHRRSDRFPGGILLCGFALRPLTWREWLMARCLRWAPGPMASLPMRQSLYEDRHRASFDGLDKIRWNDFLEVTGRTPICALAHWALQLHAADVTPLLPEIRQPVLVVCGDHDPLVPHAQQELLFNRLPNATMFQIEGGGHFPNFTRPEAIADAARRFLLAPRCGLHTH